MFVNTSPRYEILSEDALEVLDKGWKRLVTEIGIEFMSPWALEMLAAADVLQLQPGCVQPHRPILNIVRRMKQQMLLQIRRCIQRR